MIKKLFKLFKLLGGGVVGVLPYKGRKSANRSKASTQKQPTKAHHLATQKVGQKLPHLYTEWHYPFHVPYFLEIKIGHFFIPEIDDVFL